MERGGLRVMECFRAAKTIKNISFVVILCLCLILLFTSVAGAEDGEP